MKSFIILLGLIIFASTTKANATVTEMEGRICKYAVTNEITSQDFQKIKQITDSQLAKKKYTQYYFCLDSEGGDIEVAISIGKEMRRMNAGAIVLSPAVCNSSCVFLLAGAVGRSVYGKVGIHRPYSSNTEKINHTTAQKNHNRIASLIKSYLYEMNIPDSFFDAMNSVPSESIKILSTDELQFYGLNQDDAVDVELTNTYLARKYGISKAEVLARKATLDGTCKVRDMNLAQVSNFVSCYEKIMNGQEP